MKVYANMYALFNSDVFDVDCEFEVLNELKEDGKTVRGIIVHFEQDPVQILNDLPSEPLEPNIPDDIDDIDFD